MPKLFRCGLKGTKRILFKDQVNDGNKSCKASLNTNNSNLVAHSRKAKNIYIIKTTDGFSILENSKLENNENVKVFYVMMVVLL